MNKVQVERPTKFTNNYQSKLTDSGQTDSGEQVYRTEELIAENPSEKKFEYVRHSIL